MVARLVRRADQRAEPALPPETGLMMRPRFLTAADVVAAFPELARLSTPADRWRWWPVLGDRRQIVAVVGEFVAPGLVDVLYIAGTDTASMVRVDTDGPTVRPVRQNAGSLAAVVAQLAE